MNKITLNIKGMSCSACCAAIENALKKTDGVTYAAVNLIAEKAVVEFDDSKLSLAEIKRVITKSGYSVVDKTSQNLELQQKENKLEKIKLIAAVVITVPLFYIAMAPMLSSKLPLVKTIESNVFIFSLIQLLMTIPVIVIGYKFYLKGFKNLFKLKPNMDSLIAVGTTASFLYSIYGFVMITLGNHHYAHSLYFESTAVIITLILLGKYIERKSTNKTNNAIKKLMDLTPKTVIVFRQKNEIEISIEDVLINDIIICKEGQSIAVDGIIIQGKTSIDESMLTGESIPIDKDIDDEVFGGTINLNGSIRYKATSTVQNSTLSKIIELAENASLTKAPIAKLADKLSGIFVPVVMLIAVLAFVIWSVATRDFSLGLVIFVSVLVIA